jgi:uncharacterized membrane protein SpoIIM required for sporulation
MATWKIFLGFGFFFGIIAGVMAFLISYSEYAKHFPTKSYPRKMALRSAVVTFFFFVILSGIIGYFLSV